MKQFPSDHKTVIGLLVQASELKRSKDYRAALACYFKVLEEGNESAALLSSVAFCYFAIALSPQGTDQDCFESVSWVEKAIALEPHNSFLYTCLGEYCSLATLDYKRAAQAYRKAIYLDPCNLKALVGAAALYGVPEEVVTLEEAINWLERAVQLDPDDPNHHFRLGELYHEAGCLSDAEEEWVRSLLCSQPLASDLVQTVKSTLKVQKDA